MAKRNPRKGALEKVLRHFQTLEALADAIGVSVQAVSQWEEVPVERCVQINRLTGIALNELRPDIYPKDFPKGRRAPCQPAA